MTDASLHRAGGWQLRISPERRDFLVLTAWIATTFVEFQGDKLLLYPLALYYAYTIGRDQKLILPLVARSWIVLLFPIWCVLSVTWAVVPIGALKDSAYLFLTMLICYQVAANLQVRTVMLAVLLATGLIGVINMLWALGPGDLHRGIFGQKNTMGKNMVVLWIVSLATVLDPGVSRLWRMAALGLAAIAAMMASLSESATAVLLILASSMILVTGAVVLRGGVFRASRLFIASLFVAILSGLASLVLPMLTIDPVAYLLEGFGKDTTLTGRTLLWDYAKDQIAERPLLGVGAGGYWRYDASPVVRAIYAEFYRGPNAVFNFHNSYFEIAVHQGMIGLGLAVAAIVWGVMILTRAALVLGTMPLIWLFSHMMVVMARTATEADFLKPFTLFHMIFWIGALIALRLLKRAPSERRSDAGKPQAVSH